MKAVRIYLLSVLCLTLGLLYGFSPAEKKSKATWIWQAEYIARQKQDVLRFCAQNEITRLYVRFDMSRPYREYQSFIREATAQGIEVHAVAGHPAWALGDYRQRMLKLVQWVGEYNHSSSETERIRGIQLDIEPYLLPQWEEDRERVIREWQANMREFTDRVKQDGLETSVAMPFWLDEITVPGDPHMPLSRWIISRFDTICIMGYRDTLSGPNGLLALVEQEMTEADELGKPMLIAVNLKKLSDDHASFAEEGVAEMNRQLALLPEKLQNHPSYAGTAIHDYRRWRELSDLPATDQPATDQPDTYMGTYIWRAELVQTEKDEIIAFAKQHGLNLLYTRIDMHQPASTYKEFIREAHAAGIEVHAMGGHPVWALTESRGKIMKLIDWVKKYNASARPDEKFRGIHLDIEPYVMPVWGKDKESVLQQWMGNMQAFTEAVQEEPGLQASVDLAAWLVNTPTPGEPGTPFSHWMMQRMDHLTLMAFRDRAEGSGGIVRLVEGQMQYADSIDKKLVVAVEMKESHEGNYVSFFEEGKAEMTRHLELVARALQKYSSYQGQVVHAYDYWKKAKE